MGEKDRRPLQCRPGHARTITSGTGS
jgi:hypothetical protein